MPLILPNTIDPDTTADAIEVEQNNGVLTQYVNTNVITRDGAVAMTNPLLLAGDPTQPNHASNKGYVDSKVAKTGDTMTGQLNFITSAESIAAAGNIRSGQQVVGAVMYVTGAAQDANPNALTRRDFVLAQVAAEASTRTSQDTYYYNTLRAEYQAGDANIYGLCVKKAGDTMSGSLHAGGDPFQGATGSLLGTNAMACNSDVPGQGTLYLFRNGAGWADGQAWVVFCGATGAYMNGSITMAPGTGVSYNTTSDHRLKDDLGPVDDPVGKLMALQPKHLRWKSDQSEFDGFIAHEVDEVVPNAVTGVKDAVKSNDDQFDPGGVDPQMLDVSKLVPLLTAALQNALERIAVLEAAA